MNISPYRDGQLVDNLINISKGLAMKSSSLHELIQHIEESDPVLHRKLLTICHDCRDFASAINQNLAKLRAEDLVKHVAKNGEYIQKDEKE